MHKYFAQLTFLTSMYVHCQCTPQQGAPYLETGMLCNQNYVSAAK